MNSTFTPTLTEKLTIYGKEKQHHFALYNDFYERYASAFYGEIKRNLYQQEVCDKILIDAYHQIWENIANFDQSKDKPFIWCFRILRKEINKKKVELLLKDIFACQQNYPLNKVA